MEDLAPSQIVDQTSLVTLELFDQVIIPTELALNSSDLISIAIREAEIPLRPAELDDINCPNQTESVPPTIKCKNCSFTTSYKEYLTRHMRTHNAKQFSCKLCDYKTNSESGYRNHRIAHETKLLKTCRHKYCTPKCKSELNKKKCESVIKRLFNCETCSYVTESQDTLSEHTKQHSYELQFNVENEFCVICRMHINKSLMDEHMQAHTIDDE